MMVNVKRKKKSITIAPKSMVLYHTIYGSTYIPWSYKTHLFNNIVNLNLRLEVADVLLYQRELMRTSSFDVIAQMERLKGNMATP